MVWVELTHVGGRADRAAKDNTAFEVEEGVGPGELEDDGRVVGSRHLDGNILASDRAGEPAGEDRCQRLVLHLFLKPEDEIGAGEGFAAGPLHAFTQVEDVFGGIVVNRPGRGNHRVDGEFLVN